MKTRHILILGLLTIIFTGCDLGGTSNYTPSLMIYASHINKNDTLNIYITDASGTLRMDTVNLGDTVVFRTYLNGFTNNLLYYNIQQNDTSDAKILYPVTSSMDSIISVPQSDIQNGKFVFLPKQTYVYFPLRYIAKKITKTASIQFSLMSDATFNTGMGYNSVTYKIVTPVKAVPVSNQ
jgi:hypothetical protein